MSSVCKSRCHQDAVAPEFGELGLSFWNTPTLDRWCLCGWSFLYVVCPKSLFVCVFVCVSLSPQVVEEVDG